MKRMLKQVVSGIIHKLWVPVSILAAVLIISGVMFAVTQFGSKDKDSKDASKNSEEYNIGDEVSVGDLIYTVESAVSTNVITDGDQVIRTTDEVLVINLTIENEGKDEITIDQELFQLIDAKDKSHEPDEEFLGKFSEELVPGDLEDYILIFYISPIDKVYTLQVSAGSASKKQKRYDGAYLDITDQGDGSFYHYFYSNSGANSGEVDGIATAIDNKAIYKGAVAM